MRNKMKKRTRKSPSERAVLSLTSADRNSHRLTWTHPAEAPPQPGAFCVGSFVSSLKCDPCSKRVLKINIKGGKRVSLGRDKSKRGVVTQPGKVIGKGARRQDERKRARWNPTDEECEGSANGGRFNKVLVKEGGNAGIASPASTGELRHWQALNGGDTPSEFEVGPISGRLGSTSIFVAS